MTYTNSLFAIGPDKASNLRMARLQTAIVQVKRMLGDLILYNNDWRLTAKAFDLLNPVFRIKIFYSASKSSAPPRPFSTSK
jgi:hypothetical protein